MEYVENTHWQSLDQKFYDEPNSLWIISMEY